MTGPETLRRSGATAMALAAALWLVAQAEAATCGPAPDVVASADVVFVGTLTAADSTGTQATFAVEEVWKGDDLPSVVAVTGSPGQWFVPAPLTRYLVLATAAGGTLHVGNECNQAYLWDASMAAQRPSTAHPPLSASTDAVVEVPVPILVIAGIVALVAGVSLVAFRGPRTPTDGAD